MWKETRVRQGRRGGVEAQKHTAPRPALLVPTAARSDISHEKPRARAALGVRRTRAGTGHGPRDRGTHPARTPHGAPRPQAPVPGTRWAAAGSPGTRSRPRSRGGSPPGSPPFRRPEKVGRPSAPSPPASPSGQRASRPACFLRKLLSDGRGTCHIPERRAVCPRGGAPGATGSFRPSFLLLVRWVKSGRTGRQAPPRLGHRPPSPRGVLTGVGGRHAHTTPCLGGFTPRQVFRGRRALGPGDGD